MLYAAAIFIPQKGRRAPGTQLCASRRHAFFLRQEIGIASELVETLTAAGASILVHLLTPSPVGLSDPGDVSALIPCQTDRARDRV